MAVECSPTLPFLLVTKDSVIIELVYVNLIIKIVSKVGFFCLGGGGCSRGWALNQINTVVTFGLRTSIKFVYVLTMIMAIFQR